MQFENACLKSGVSPLPTNRAQKTPFWMTSQLSGNLMAYIFGTKHDIDNQTSALQTTRGLLYRLETT